MWRKTTVISVLWIWHAEQSSLKFDWANYNIRAISVTLFPWTFRFIFFGSVVMENNRFSSRARFIKAEGLWGREFLKAWPSRFYSANNSFHYKDLSCPRDGFQYSIQMALSTAVQRCAKIPVTCCQYLVKSKHPAQLNQLNLLNMQLACNRILLKYYQGHPTTIFGKYLFGRRFEI